MLGTVEVNPILWTLKLEFWGSVVLLLYTLAVEPCPSTSPPYPLDSEHDQSNKVSLAALNNTSLTTFRSPMGHGRRTWWLRSIVTLSFTILLIGSICDAETTLVFTVMLLGAHIPLLPRLSKRSAWCILAVAAYLGGFQYDRAMYFSSKRFIADQTGAVKHPATYVFGGRLQAKHVSNSAGALLAVVHAQTNISLGGLFLWLPETIFGSYCVPYAIVLLLYLFATYGLASTIFLEIGKKAISISRDVTAWIDSNK